MPIRFPGCCLIVCTLLGVTGVKGKWVEGRINTKENWAFLARFCFLSLDGQFEYLIEFDRDMGTPNLLLYYDEESQWPAVYHSEKTCKERELVLNKAGQNQIIKLSHWYPDTEYSGCIVRKEDKELPAEKSTTVSTSKAAPTRPSIPAKPRNNTSSSWEHPRDPAYYDQFLKNTTEARTKSADTTATSTHSWYELVPTDEFDASTASTSEVEQWESIGEERKNGSQLLENLKDVEILFDGKTSGGRIKRSTSDLYNRFRQRRLKSDSESNPNLPSNTKRNTVERLVVSCHNTRRFRSARERWWFIAISNCDSDKGLDVTYKFLMTNGPSGDFWREHFSADEFYVLPILLAYTFAYVIMMLAVVMCSVELKSRHLLHSTYKLFVASVVAQHFGVLIQSLAYVRYAVNGLGNEGAKTTGLFLCGISEMTFLLLLVLMAKGYTITRGRLKVGFTVKLTIFMCSYIITYIVLFIYQAKAFDPGEVLYLYESPAGYSVIVLRVLAWVMFAYSTFFTLKKHSQKVTFYCPFFICGTMWFYAGPLFILTANSYIDKWVRESVVTAVLHLITFSGHVMFLLLTLPVYANKNFPYHVRTTQVGVMEVRGSSSLDNFGQTAYYPSSGGAQTVIIPLTRRTEELIGNICNQYMATAPPLPSDDTAKQNGLLGANDSASPKSSLIKQGSTDTNSSDDIKPYVSRDDEIFTIQGEVSKLDKTEENKLRLESVSPYSNIQHKSLGENKNEYEKLTTVLPDDIKDTVLPLHSNESHQKENSRNELPSVVRSKRNILDPITINKDEVPSWSLAKGPCVVSMLKKSDATGNGDAAVRSPPSNSTNNAKKVPPVRNGLPSSGEISTIHEGHVQTFQNKVSRATIDLFTVGHERL